MKLSARCRTEGVTRPLLGRITTDPRTTSDRSDLLLLTGGAASVEEGFLAILASGEWTPVESPRLPVVYLADDLNYFDDGDVVRIDPSGVVHSLYRGKSPHNFILMTDQCNSYCLMCSQPPKKVDDRDRVAEHLKLIDLIDTSTPELGITGGEPTLFGDDFIRIVARCRDRLPGTALHVLTNGRAFYYREFARQLADVRHPDLMLGIPLYSPVDSRHDFVVQASGAFEETVIGLLHLSEAGVPVEIRIVIHAQTVDHLTALAEFITRNLPFASRVALMGLEMFGFTRPNIDKLWIDPHNYRVAIEEAVEILALAGLNVSIYNHQLCTLPPSLWPFAVRSISDWKNVYLDQCSGCVVKERCGGFFESAVWRHSNYITPITGDGLRFASASEVTQPTDPS